MSSSRDGRRDDLVAQARAELAERHERAAEPAGRSGGGRGIALLIPAGLVAVVVASVTVGEPLRQRVHDSGCALTGCTGTGMATLGWLLIALPFGWTLATVGLWSRLSRPARAAAVLVGGVLGLVGWLHVPGRRSSLDRILDGPGSPAMATGIRWAGIGVALALLVSLVVTIRRRDARLGVALAAVAMLGTLVTAVVRAEPVPLTAAQAMPERTFTVAGDTLRRTSAADQRGCARVLPDDRLLDGCLRTVKVSYTTDDSDAVVRFAAVFFPSERTARDRRGGLRRGVAQTGVDGDVITVASTSGSWILLTSVGHADGRTIAEADRGHLLWAAKQVAYRFIGRQVGLMLAPSPGEGIGPRTP